MEIDIAYKVDILTQINNFPFSALDAMYTGSLYHHIWMPTLFWTYIRAWEIYIDGKLRLVTMHYWRKQY